MHFCFVDESGGFEAPAANPGATPLMTLVGLIVDGAALPAITTQFIQAKMRFFPGKSTSKLFLDHIRDEVKGADLRFSLRSSSRRDRRHAIGYLDRILQILNTHNVRLVGRVWIKPVGQPLDPDATYTYAIQDIARHFHAFLDANNENGLLLCDSRMHNQNAQVSHSVFTQKHGLRGDPLPRIPEAPVFGVSLNHAGLQLADAVASALIFPIASRVYCSHQWPGIHTDAHFEAVRQRYSAQLRAREFRYQDLAGRTHGGIVVSDRLRSWPSSRLLRYP
jgi:Protein of unknown function (DUF3800)